MSTDTSCYDLKLATGYTKHVDIMIPFSNPRSFEIMSLLSLKAESSKQLEMHNQKVQSKAQFLEITRGLEHDFHRGIIAQ